MEKLTVNIQFLYPYRIVPWKNSNDRKEDAEYRRGGSFAKWHMIDASKNRGRPYITGTLLRSALFREMEKTLVDHDPFDCCFGEDETGPDLSAPLFLRKRRLYSPGREKAEPCCVCPLCLSLGRGDKYRRKDKIRGRDKSRWTVHFDNMWELSDRCFTWEDLVGSRIVNRVDPTDGKARDYIRIREIDPVICSRFGGDITIDDKAVDAPGVAHLKMLMAVGLARLNLLAGSLCRIDIVSEDHDALIERFLDLGEKTRSGVVSGHATSLPFESYELKGLDRLAQMISDAIGSESPQQLRRMADAVRDFRRAEPSIVHALPGGKTGGKPSIWDKPPRMGKRTVREILETEAGNIPVELWRTFCEQLGRELYNLHREKAEEDPAPPRILGETEFYGPAMQKEVERDPVPAGKEKFPTVEWIVSGELIAETPFFFGVESREDHTSASILLTRDGSFRLPRTVIRGALRRDLRLAVGDGCNAAVGGPRCTCDVCGIMRHLVVEDAVAGYREPPEIRHRIRMDPHAGTVAEGALFDMETGFQGMRFPFRLYFKSKRSLDPNLIHVLNHWSSGMAVLGGDVGVGMGRFRLEGIRASMLHLSRGKAAYAFYLAGRGLKGVSHEQIMETAEKSGVRLKTFSWEAASRLPSGLPRPPRELPWTPVEYTLEIVSPLISRDPISAMMDPRNADAVMVRKTVLTSDDNGGLRPENAPRYMIKGESIRGALRAILARRERCWDKDHEDCDCLQCRLFGSVHRQGALRFEDAEVLGPASDKKMDHVAIDRFTGGGVEHLKFDDYPLPACPTAPLHLQGRFWIPRKMKEEEKKALERALADFRDGVASVGGLGAIGYGVVGDLILDTKLLDPPANGDVRTVFDRRGCRWPSIPRRFEIGHIHNPHYFLKPGEKGVERETGLVSHVDDQGDGDLALYSGTIQCRLNTLGPIFTPDSSDPDEDYFRMKAKYKDHKSLGFFRINGKPAIPGATLRGVVSSVYEALTNSCFRIMDRTRRLSWRMPAESSDLQYFRPGRIVWKNDQWMMEELEDKVRFGKSNKTNIPIRVPVYDDPNILREFDLTKAGRLISRHAPALRAEIAKSGAATVASGVELSPKHRYPHQVDEIVTALRGGKRKGFLKFTGPNKVEKIDVKHDKIPKALDEIPGDESDALRVVHNNVDKVKVKKRGRVEIKYAPYFAGRKGDHIYIMNKRCERIFLQKQGPPSFLPIPRSTRKRYEQLHKEYRENAKRNKIPKVFRTRLPAEPMTHGDLVFFRKTGDRVTDIAPVKISRVVDDRPIGKRFPDNDDSFQPCMHACLHDCRGCPETCEKTRDYFSPHPEGLCPACHLFGTTFYKGRVSFGMAWLDVKNGAGGPRWRSPDENDPRKGEGLTLPLLERPRPTWSMPDKNSEIPGRKFYVHHPWSVEAIEENQFDPDSEPVKNSDKYSDSIRPDENNRTIEALDKGNEFKFDVKFNNLREWELGLLLYALELEDGLAHKLGMAKAHGFGSVEILVESLSLKSGKPGESSKKSLIEAGFRRLGVHGREDLKRDGRRHIRQLRELLWFPPEGVRTEVRYPLLERKKGDDTPGYTDFVKKNDPETGRENKTYLDREARLAILRAPWKAWHPISRKALAMMTAAGKKHRPPRAAHPDGRERKKGPLKKIWVGNLPYEAEEERIREEFSPYGVIHSLDYVMDRKTGKFKGFCFLMMEEKSADEAIRSLNGRRFGGRPMKVNEARNIEH